jgi:hypothetical protein
MSENGLVQPIAQTRNRRCMRSSAQLGVALIELHRL